MDHSSHRCRQALIYPVIDESLSSQQLYTLLISNVTPSINSSSHIVSNRNWQNSCRSSTFGFGLFVFAHHRLFSVVIFVAGDIVRVDWFKMMNIFIRNSFTVATVWVKFDNKIRTKIALRSGKCTLSPPLHRVDYIVWFIITFLKNFPSNSSNRTTEVEWSALAVIWSRTLEMARTTQSPS